MITRLCEKTDIKKCAALFRKVFTSPPFQYEWLSEDSVFAYLSDMKDTPKFMGFVLQEEETGNIAAACFGIVSDYFLSPYYEIKEIFLSPNIQGKGKGSHFLSEIEKILFSKNIKSISLSTEKTIPAYTFYQKNGYSSSTTSEYMFKNL